MEIELTHKQRRLILAWAKKASLSDQDLEWMEKQAQVATSWDVRKAAKNTVVDQRCIRQLLEKLDRLTSECVKPTPISAKDKEEMAMAGHINLYRARHRETGLYYGRTQNTTRPEDKGKRGWHKMVKTNLRKTPKNYVSMISESWLNSYRDREGRLIEGCAHHFIVEKLSANGKWVDTSKKRIM